jgi:hypothetical protein
MSGSTDSSAPPGRPIRLVPTPPGFWPLLLGVCAAALAPLFGFLIGSGTGSTDPDALMHPLYWGLLMGILLGGVGVLVALLGGRRLWRHLHPRPTGQDADALQDEAAGP